VITHPEKVLFPDDGITKGELAAYYEEVAPAMVPLIRGRPVTMERFPSGIGEKGFMQKNVSRGFPARLQRVEVPKKGGVVNYPLVSETRDLLWVANQNCITPHVWTSRLPGLERPDICVFDLDPSEDDPAVLRTSTLAVRDVLAEAGLESVVKTSGSKGFHIVAPLSKGQRISKRSSRSLSPSPLSWSSATRST
jgi:bifunctional non-homologous end joining protein LigD